MEASKAKKSKHDDKKKHIDFKGVVKQDGQKKEPGSGRGKSSKLGPKYDRELKKFREETLEKIKIFRQARGNWIRSSEGEADLQKIDSKIFYGLEIDRRRAAIMKKLGFKMSMIRPHRKTLRPRRYFTMKRKISTVNYGRDRGLLGPGGELGESPLIQEFRKKAKKATLKMAKKEEVEREKLIPTEGWETDGSKSGKAKIVDGTGTAQEPPEYRTSKAIADQKGEIARAEPEQLPGTEKDVTDAGELTGGPKEEAGELLSKQSRDEFDKIVAELKASFKFDENAVTDADVEEMEKLWREYRSATVKKKGTKAKSVDVGSSTLRFLEKINPKNSEWWKKRKEGKGFRRSADAKPCTCQILEGDGVFIVKNVCECAVQCKRKTVAIQDTAQVIGTPEEGNLSVPVAKPAEAPSKAVISSSIAGKIVDSLEIIRKRVTPKASRISNTNAKANAEKESASGAAGKTDESKGTDIKDIYLPNEKFDSTTSILAKPSDDERSEEAKTAKKTKTPEVSEAREEETSATIMDSIQKLKTKRHTKAPRKDDGVLPKGEAGEEKEWKSFSKEFIGVKEVVDAKGAKPRKTWSTLSGKRKSIAESKPAKVLDDSQASPAASQPPKPILGKGKHKKTRLDPGHVSFDLAAGQSPSNSFLKYGEKKIKTVLSVVNIIKKQG